MDLERLEFNQIDINDPFFDSLKEDYKEFTNWFSRKSNEKAYIIKNSNNLIDGFLYHKIETEEINDVSPALPEKKRIKIGTFKINPHGTRLGERFLKKSLDYALFEKAEEVYVTIFSKHEYLVSSFKKYGFKEAAFKDTENGRELVLVKKMGEFSGNLKQDYPFINFSGRKFILSIYPEWHSRLLPDSILKNENPDALLEDVSHTNSIHKIYLAKMKGMEEISKGDILVIYRTTDRPGNARYRSVATSVCVVEEYKNINTFSSEEDFLKYASSYSIFNLEELKKYYKTKRYPKIIRFCYNLALNKRVTRDTMLNMGIESPYWGFFEITDQQFEGILLEGKINESIIINKA